MAYQITAKAKSDLINIAIYTEKKWGREQKRRYMASIKDALLFIAEYPGIGQVCEPININYYKYHIGKHYIFYRQTRQDRIEIIRILHQRMNIELHI